MIEDMGSWKGMNFGHTPRWVWVNTVFQALKLIHCWVAYLFWFWSWSCHGSHPLQKLSLLLPPNPNGYSQKWMKKIKLCLMNQWERKRSGEKVKESKKAEREKPMGLMEAKERDSRKRMFRERERERVHGRKNCTLPPTKLRSLCVSLCRVKTLSLSLALLFDLYKSSVEPFFHNSQNCPLRNCQTECYRCLTVSH